VTLKTCWRPSWASSISNPKKQKATAIESTFARIPLSEMQRIANPGSSGAEIWGWQGEGPVPMMRFRQDRDSRRTPSSGNPGYLSPRISTERVLHHGLIAQEQNREGVYPGAERSEGWPKAQKSWIDPTRYLPCSWHSNASRRTSPLKEPI